MRSQNAVACSSDFVSSDFLPFTTTPDATEASGDRPPGVGVVDELEVAVAQLEDRDVGTGAPGRKRAEILERVDVGAA